MDIQCIYVERSPIFSLPLIVTTTVYKYKRLHNYFLNVQEEFADTKGVIRNRKFKKNRQHDGQKKRYIRTNNDLQNIHIQLKIK